MSHFDILLPFALPPAEISSDLLKELNAPALALLTARAQSGTGGRHEHFDGFSRALPHEIWLSRQFGFQAGDNSPPVAPALMRSSGMEAESGCWFVLQPVHIHIARDHLVLTDPRQLMLSEEESRSLFEIARPLFEETGKRLIYGNKATWFLHAGDWQDLQTSTPDAAAGHNIDIWMPKGPGERDWRKVQNEVQMHWFNHPINEERTMRGLKQVNSVWLWGGGTQADCAASPYTHAFNLSGWSCAFLRCVPRHTLLDSAAPLIESKLGKEEKGLVLLDALLEPALSNDWARWLDNMKKLESDWFAPLLQALKSGTIDSVSLTTTHDSRISRFTTTRSSLRKFWVTPTLATLCP